MYRKLNTKFPTKKHQTSFVPLPKLISNCEQTHHQSDNPLENPSHQTLCTLKPIWPPALLTPNPISPNLNTPFLNTLNTTSSSIIQNIPACTSITLISIRSSHSHILTIFDTLSIWICTPTSMKQSLISQSRNISIQNWIKPLITSIAQYPNSTINPIPISPFTLVSCC